MGRNLLYFNRGVSWFQAWNEYCRQIIFVLHGLITHFINRGKTLYCAFVDFTNAFDYVVRDNMWFKLVKLGLRGSIVNIIQSIYEGVRSRVKICGKIGNDFFCNLGVRQGECLSPPFVFLVFKRYRVHARWFK